MRLFFIFLVCLNTLAQGREEVMKKGFRRLALISLDWARPKDPPLSLGHASILANLKAHNVEVEAKAWSVNTKQFNVSEVTKDILDQADSRTDVGIGTFIWNEPHVQQIIKTLKEKKFPGRIILGGPQISYVSQGIERYYPEADVFIRGYAEGALTSLMLNQEPYPFIRGVHYAGQPSLGLSATADLTHLPSPFLTGIIPPQSFIRWETQRGCPFSCSFCQHKEADPSKKRRPFAEERIDQEIDWIASSRINDIAVLDPTFNSGGSYLRILERLAHKKFQGKISLQCRIEMVSPAFLDVVQEINRFGKVVLEFGLQTIHKEEMKIIERPNNLTKIKSLLPGVIKRGIETEISLIFGLPKQTVQSFQETIDFCKDHEVSKICAFPLMLLRGTKLYDRKSELGLIESTDVHFKIPRLQDGIPHVVASPSFSYEDWLRMGEMAEKLEDNV